MNLCKKHKKMSMLRGKETNHIQNINEEHNRSLKYIFRRSKKYFWFLKVILVFFMMFWKTWMI